MPSHQDVQYHRSFLSYNYMDNFSGFFKIAPAVLNQLLRSPTEGAEIRDKNPLEFEEARKALAMLLKIPYVPAEDDRCVGDVCSAAHEGQPSDGLVLLYLGPQYAPQGAVKNPTTGLVALPAPWFGQVEAYRYGNPLLKTTIFVKLDQHFEDYATPWELRFSKLVYPYQGNIRTFAPIVNNSYQVVGHVGTVTNDAGLYYPKGYTGDFHDMIERGVPAHVSDTPPPDGRAERALAFTERPYTVRTDANGQVVSASAHATGFVETPWYSPMDLVTIGSVVVKLGAKIGAKVTTTLVRKVATRVEARAAGKAAAEAARKKLLRAAIPGATRDLVIDASKNKSVGRALTKTEMKELVQRKWDQNPYLRHLRAASALKGDARRREVLAALEKMQYYTGKTVQVVRHGAGIVAGKPAAEGYFEGAAGWARNAGTRQPVLAIEERAFQNPDMLFNEVMHDIAFDLVREGNGVPVLLKHATDAKWATFWLEGFIQNGDKAWDLLRDVAGVE